MTTEQKEAIEKLQQKLNPKEFGGYCVLGYNQKYCFGKSEVEAIETVLNLITKLQKENEILKRAFDKQTADMSNNLLELQQKDKQIDLMAEVIFQKFKAPLIIEYGIENKEQFIKIFEQKAKEKGENIDE